VCVVSEQYLSIRINEAFQPSSLKNARQSRFLGLGLASADRLGQGDYVMPNNLDDFVPLIICKLLASYGRLGHFWIGDAKQS
jgi:hypothetical protein